MLNSEELKAIKDDGMKSVYKKIPLQESSLQVLRRHTLRSMQSESANVVVQSLVNTNNIPFFREKVIQGDPGDPERQGTESESKSNLNLETMEAEGGLFKKPVVKQRVVLKNADNELITDEQIIKEAHELYVNNEESLTQCSNYQIIELLNRVGCRDLVLRLGSKARNTSP